MAIEKYDNESPATMASEPVIAYVSSISENIPCVYSVKEAKALTIQRGRDIKAGRAKLIPHDEVMSEMAQLIATYAD